MIGRMLSPATRPCSKASVSRPLPRMQKVRRAPWSPAAVPTVMQAAAPMGPQPSAQPINNQRVLTINRKFQFVVINVGMDDHVKEGDQFQILRNGNVIGLVEVEKLYDSFSAATIVKEQKDAPIDVGDGLRRLS